MDLKGIENKERNKRGKGKGRGKSLKENDEKKIENHDTRIRSRYFCVTNLDVFVLFQDTNF